MTEEAVAGQGSPHNRRCRRRAERAKQPSTHNVQLNPAPPEPRVYLGDGVIPITHTAFNEILLEVQQKRVKNTLKKLHGGEDTKKSKADDEDDEAGPKKKRADEQERARQRKYNEALSALRKHEPEWKPTSTKDGAAKKKKSAGAKPAAAATGGGD